MGNINNIYSNKCSKQIKRGVNMKLTIKKPGYLEDGTIGMIDIKQEEIVVDKYSILSIDGSTSNSGLAILREHDGALLYSISAKRDSSGETPVQYKVRLKRVVKDILERNKFIYQVYYEEPVVANISSVKNLFMLRTFIEELIVESEPQFDYIKHYEVSNMRWKKEFLAPDKVPQGTENQKKAVRERLEAFIPCLKVVSQDEIDATAMGFVATKMLKDNKNAGEDLQSKKKIRPFQYNIKFIGADDDDCMLTELWDIYNGPESLMQAGIKFIEINGKENFEKSIYNTMGEEDKVVIIKFSSSHHANIVLQHRIGNLAAQYQYIYAVVWRKTRKH